MIIEVTPSRFYFILKRVLDIVLALTGLLVLIPLFCVVALFIKWEEPAGTIFFKQSRVGKNEKRFWMYKFRSMRMDAEDKLDSLLQKNEVSGAMFKMKNDPRITKIGKFLRKTSVDELPQLWNVLKGDMSLVGPRPPLPREVEQYTAYHKRRLLIKPGCTGLWQVSGRNKVDFFQMVELDLQYISQVSLALDLKIIFKTVFVMVVPNDAY